MVLAVKVIKDKKGKASFEEEYNLQVKINRKKLDHFTQ